ncbi:MAG: hypothetical protein PHX84_00210 [Candidatus Shapirobacteria bacterium]|nr:hypothetical protein [Candidatus Shapirobacteria bacterium]
MNIVKIGNRDWLLEVDLDGGRIYNLAFNNQIILGTFERIDGKKGNTHVCVPNFANEGVNKYGFLFHGPFRNETWQVSNKSNMALEIKCEIDGLLVTQFFRLTDGFSQDIEVLNNSNEKKKVNLAVHNYWDTEFGWQGTKLNGVDITDGIKTNTEIRLKNTNIIEIVGKKNIIWKVENFKFAKLWTGVKQENGINSYDKKYICIEPEMEFEGYVETEKSWLEIGRKINLRQSFRLE